ncbi:MAG: dockerin type I repeat-containing protein, partial [Ruminococcus sp.]|nr:dockerin type I repeat-containing protein [Ruminococcus sp.]
GIAGTNDVTASFVPTTSGLYTIYEYLYLDKNGTRVQVANNVIYLSVKDGYQIFEAHATVDAPAHGRLPDFDAVTDTEHVKVVDVDWSKRADDGEYYLMDDNETFVAGEYYECIVVFEATDGYTFFDTPTGTVNSKDRILYNHDEQRAAFGVQFECPLGVVFTDDSAAVAGGKLEVDVERMAELDDELMQAYFDGAVTYKWFYDGRLKTTTKNNSYEIKNSMLGHYIAVKVVYGDKSIVSEEFEITKASTTGKLGDVDGDGDISIMDATAVQLHIASLDILTADELSRADTDGDGDVSIMDATAIQLFVARLITEF